MSRAVGVLARELETLRDTVRGWVAATRRAWEGRPGAARTAAIAFAAGAALAGAASLVEQVRLPERLPSARDWAALRALVERDARPGDAVALSPPWLERAREVLPASLPIFSQPSFAGEDLLGVRRVWLVSVPRAPGFSWAAEAELLRRSGQRDLPRRLGAFEVSRLELAFPVLPLAFLPDRLAPAPPDQGAAAAREVRDAGGAPRPCVVAEAAGGRPLSFAFAPVRVGRAVRGHVAAVGAPPLAGPVRVEVRVDGEEVGTADVPLAGFAPFQVDTTRFAGQVRPLSIVVTAPGAGAQLCLDAATLP